MSVSSTIEARPRPAFRTEPEAAAYLSISYATLRRWRLKGIGPKCFHVGDIVRYRQEDLETFIEANSTRVA